MGLIQTMTCIAFSHRFRFHTMIALIKFQVFPYVAIFLTLTALIYRIKGTEQGSSNSY